MELPANVLSLISAYSKPVTRPDWKKGTPHADIFKYSDPLEDIKIALVHKKMYYPYLNYNTLFNTQFWTVLYNKTFNEVIKLYGEQVFNVFIAFDPNQMNFYRYCRLTAHLKILKNKKIDIPTKMIIHNL